MSYVDNVFLIFRELIKSNIRLLFRCLTIRIIMTYRHKGRFIILNLKSLFTQEAHVKVNISYIMLQ